MQARALGAIRACRTPRLGGFTGHCPRCGHEQRICHACRNRHCPLCQDHKRREWIEALSRQLLPVPYFHVVVTVAEELNAVIRYNRALLYDLLFRESAGALKQFGRDPRWLGGEIGLIGVLHTWGQMLQFHPHIHYIVPQGGIDGQGRWIEPK